MAHYHFIGIGGIGMGKLASLLLSQGQRVSGSDVVENNMVKSLRAQGAGIVLGHTSGNIASPDCVVFSSAIKESNPELAAARAQGCRIVHRAELLAQLMTDFDAVTVAGAHGKTTTTSMIAHLLLESGLDPTVALGGVFQQGTYKESLGRSRYFVAELDESDGSFLRFSPLISVITNIDFEHVDYYGTWEKILEAYRVFINRTRPDGLVIACGEDQNLSVLIKESGRKYLRYGFDRGFDFYAANIIRRSCGMDFECFHNGFSQGVISLALFGRHNILNALAAVAAGTQLGLSFSAVASALAAYQGVHRRFEWKGQCQDIVVYDDYAHHPTEIRSALEAARLLGRRRLVAVFQPHRYSRTKFLWDKFQEAFGAADFVLVTDIYAASEEPIPGVHASDLSRAIARQSGCETEYCPRMEVAARAAALARDGDLVMTLGAGDIVRVSEQIVALLKERTVAGYES